MSFCSRREQRWNEWCPHIIDLSNINFFLSVTLMLCNLYVNNKTNLLNSSLIYHNCLSVLFWCWLCVVVFPRNHITFIIVSCMFIYITQMMLHLISDMERRRLFIMTLPYTCLSLHHLWFFSYKLFFLYEFHVLLPYLIWKFSFNWLISIFG